MFVCECVCVCGPDVCVPVGVKASLSRENVSFVLLCNPPPAASDEGFLSSSLRSVGGGGGTE